MYYFSHRGAEAQGAVSARRHVSGLIDSAVLPRYHIKILSASAPPRENKKDE